MACILFFTHGKDLVSTALRKSAKPLGRYLPFHDGILDCALTLASLDLFLHQLGDTTDDAIDLVETIWTATWRALPEYSEPFEELAELEHGGVNGAGSQVHLVAHVIAVGLQQHELGVDELLYPILGSGDGVTFLICRACEQKHLLHSIQQSTYSFFGHGASEDTGKVTTTVRQICPNGCRGLVH